MSELYTIEAVAPGPSNAVRSHDHPMLESGNLSFPEGRYLLDFLPGEDRSSYVIEHRIEGAALIERLLGSGQARYACIVSSPISSYRRTHLSSEPRHEVGWNSNDLGESPLFTPMILLRRVADDHRRFGSRRRTPDSGTSSESISGRAHDWRSAASSSFRRRFFSSCRSMKTRASGRVRSSST